MDRDPLLTLDGGQPMLGKIFISYRRGDDPGSAGRLFDALKDTFETDQLFIDVDNIEPGLDFVQVIQERIAQSQILLAVIGKYWGDARDEVDGSRRLDNPSDSVRIEIESALDQNKRVIPVLVGGGKMPAKANLPESLRPLSQLNYVQIRHERFGDDTARLTDVLKHVLRSSGVDQPEATREENRSRAVGLFANRLHFSGAGRSKQEVPARFGAVAQHMPAVRSAIGILAALVAMSAVAASFATSYFGPTVPPAFPAPSGATPENGPTPSPRWCLDKTLKPDELRVCGVPALLRLDSQLSDLYSAVLAMNTPDKRQALRDDQRVWLRDKRGGCLQDEDCLSTMYKERIAYLVKLKNS
jgi:hypothetical protein